MSTEPCLLTSGLQASCETSVHVGCECRLIHNYHDVYIHYANEAMPYKVTKRAVLCLFWQVCHVLLPGVTRSICTATELPYSRYMPGHEPADRLALRTTLSVPQDVHDASSHKLLVPPGCLLCILQTRLHLAGHPIGRLFQDLLLLGICCSV